MKYMTFKIIVVLKTKVSLVECKSCIVVHRHQCIRTCYLLYPADKYSRCLQNVVTHLPKFMVSDCNLKKECQPFHCCVYCRMLVRSCYHHQQWYTKLFSIDLKKKKRLKILQRHSWNNYKYKYVEIKCQLDATEVCIADLIACSTCFGHHYAHHQELKSIIQWLLPVVFCAVKM